MKKIVSLTERRKKENEMDEDLTVLLKKAQKLKKKQLVEYYGDIILIKDDLEKFLIKEINNYLFSKRLIEHSFFTQVFI